MYEIRKTIRKDFCAYKSKFSIDGIYPQAHGTLIGSMLVPAFAVVVRYRIYRSLYKSKSRLCRLLSKYLYVRTIKKYGCDIHPNAQIGVPFKIGHCSDVVIGPEAVLGSNCYIFNGVSIGNRYPGDKDEMPIIGDNVVIGTGAKLLGNISIGNRAKIGALSLIISNVDTGNVAVGIPYRPNKDELG